MEYSHCWRRLELISSLEKEFNNLIKGERLWAIAPHPFGFALLI